VNNLAPKKSTNCKSLSAKVLIPCDLDQFYAQMNGATTLSLTTFYIKALNPTIETRQAE